MLILFQPCKFSAGYPLNAELPLVKATGHFDDWFIERRLIVFRRLSSPKWDDLSCICRSRWYEKLCVCVCVYVKERDRSCWWSAESWLVDSEDHSGILAFWRRKWQPTPVFSPGESHRQRTAEPGRLYSLWGRKKLDSTERLTHRRWECWQWRACWFYNRLKDLCWMKQTVIRTLSSWQDFMSEQNL